MHKVPTRQTDKNPGHFPTKLQAICRTNTHLFIKIIREHHA